MRTFSIINCWMLALLLSIAAPAFGAVTVDPFGIAVGIDDEDILEVEVTLANDGDADVAYDIRPVWLREGRDDRFGPRRDDPGDILDRFVPPGAAASHYNVGLAWDTENSWMWNNDFHNGTCSALDPANDYQAAVQFNVVDRCMSIGLLNGHLYMVVDPQSYLTHYNRDGDHLENVQFNYTTFAVTASQEMELLFVMGSDGAVHVNTMDEDGMLDQEVGAIRNWAGFLNNGACRSMCWIDLHPDGQLWFQSTRGPNGEGGNWLWQMAVDTENWEITDLVQVFQSRAGNSPQHWDGVGHDGENLWVSFWEIQEAYVMDDGVAEVRLLSVDPSSGVIPGDDANAVTISVDPSGAEPGVYNHNLEITLTEGDVESMLIVSVVVTIDGDVATIAGTVTDAADNSPVEGVSVALDRYIITRYSDDEGNYSLTDLPPGDYAITFIAPDYLPVTEGVSIEDEDIDLDVALLHAEFSSDPDHFDYTLEPEMRQEFDLTVTNDGNGPLTYYIERNLVGEANADPWALRYEVNAEDSTGDNQLNGVVMVDGLFYVSGGNNGQDINFIYIFNQDGELIDQFEQFHESRYGMRDLTYDGTLIWGADETTLYGFTTEGELEQTINGQARSYRALAWDVDRSVFWSADVTSDIFETDLEGNQVGTINVPVETRIYGLSYWADDPDGYCLYIFTRGDVDSIECQVNKLNVETGEQMVVAALADVAGRPSGFDVTNQYDIYSWVVAGLVQGPPDRIMVWQLEGRRDWFQIEPTAGQIAAGEAEDFVVVLDATGLPADNEFVGEIVFIHDGIGSRSVIPVTLLVTEGDAGLFRELELELGWNTVSVNIEPYEEDVEVLTQPLVDAGLLEIMKDDEGRFYIPAFGHNSIPGWYVQEGYMIKVSEAVTLRLAGVSILRDRPIPLHQGWQLISYYPNFPVEATLALTNIEDNLIICKDGYGNFYVPAWDYSNIGDMVRGQGYYLKMSADDELVYTIAEGDDRQVAQASRPSSPRTRGSRLLPIHQITGENMSLLVKADVDVDVAVFAGDALVGSGVLCNGVCGIAVWGDDPTTPETDGALEGQALTLMINDADVDVDERMVEVDYRVLAGEMVYKKDVLAVVEIDASNAIPTEFAITGAYPNPFNSATTISYSLPEQAQISLKLYDVSGREVETLVDKLQKAGNYSIPWNAIDFPSGVYFCRLDVKNDRKMIKLALIR